MTLQRLFGIALLAATLGFISPQTASAISILQPQVGYPIPQLGYAIDLNITVGPVGTVPIGWSPIPGLDGPRYDVAYEGPLAALGAPRPAVVAVNQGAVNVTGNVSTNPIAGDLQIVCKDQAYLTCNVNGGDGFWIYNMTLPVGGTTKFTCPFEVIVKPPPPTSPNPAPPPANIPNPNGIWQWTLTDGLVTDYPTSAGFLSPTSISGGAIGQSRTVARTAYLTSQPEATNFVAFSVIGLNNANPLTLTNTGGDTCGATVIANGSCPPLEPPPFPPYNAGNVSIPYCVDLQFTIPAGVTLGTYFVTAGFYLSFPNF